MLNGTKEEEVAVGGLFNVYPKRKGRVRVGVHKDETWTVILFLYVKEVETGLKAAYDSNVNVL